MATGLAPIPEPPVVVQVVAQSTDVRPTGFDGFALQSTSDLDHSNGWSHVATTLNEQAGMNHVMVPMTSNQQFFRLAR